MNVTPRKREQIDIRRAAVARYRAMGYTAEAIVEALANEGIRPRNNARWGRRTINKDIDHLKQRYVLNADSDIAKWLDAELDILNFAMQSAVQGVADKTKQVVGYRHVQRRDPATGSVQEVKEPIFETVENLQAIDRVVKIAESRRKLLALDKVFKMPTEEKDDIASRTADRIAEAFRMAAPTAAPSDDPPADAAADTAA